MVLLTIPLIASAEPPGTIWGVHPASVVILISYAFGLKLLSDIKDDPMWKPVQTSETRESLSDPEEGEDRESGRSLWGRFALYAGITAVAGYVIGDRVLRPAMVGVSKGGPKDVAASAEAGQTVDKNA